MHISGGNKGKGCRRRAERMKQWECQSSLARSVRSQVLAGRPLVVATIKIHLHAVRSIQRGLANE
jgi:hypothetical protein